ncbi:hypothetical protein, partial [Eubacterium ventriosum]|uniref:hypothetical protein n=1 Tax=Eubacterium ventriosum TaxID=39496 RepID=UPI000FEF2621
INICLNKKPEYKYQYVIGYAKRNTNINMLLVMQNYVSVGIIVKRENIIWSKRLWNYRTKNIEF